MGNFSNFSPTLIGTPRGFDRGGGGGGGKANFVGFPYATAVIFYYSLSSRFPWLPFLLCVCLRSCPEICSPKAILSSYNSLPVNCPCFPSSLE